MTGRICARRVAVAATTLGLVVAVRDVSAQVMRKGQMRKAPVAVMRLYTRITGFEITGGTKPGDKAAFKITIATTGAISDNVGWQVLAVNAATVLASGTLTNAAPGNTYSITGTWTATVGEFAIVAMLNPATTIVESGQALADHRTQPVNRVYSDWARWMPAAVTALRQGGGTWTRSLRFRDVTFRGPLANNGKLVGDDFMGHVRPAMIAAGAPGFIADAVLQPIADAVNVWRGSVAVTSLPWYPVMAIVYSPSPPPVLNVPWPLAGLKQDPKLLEATKVGTAMHGRLGAATNWPGASAIDGVTRNVAGSFATWIATTPVTMVMGKTTGCAILSVASGNMTYVCSGIASSGDISPLGNSNPFALLPNP